MLTAIFLASLVALGAVTGLLLSDAYERFTVKAWLRNLIIAAALWALWHQLFTACQIPANDADAFARALFDAPAQGPQDMPDRGANPRQARDNATENGMRIE